MHKRVTVLLCSILLVTPTYANESYVIGVNLAVDSADGISAGGIVDYAFNENTAVTLDIGITRAEGTPVDVQTTFWDVSLSHDFGPLGVQGAIGQWGDRDEFTSDNWSFGFFRSFSSLRVSANYIERSMELTFRSAQNNQATTTSKVTSQGTEINASYSTDTGRSIFASATKFDYNRPVTRLNQLQIVRLLSPTSLTLSGSLLDHSIAAGVDIPINDHLLSLTLSRDRTAVDKIDVDSLAIGWLQPIGLKTDIELGLGVSRDGSETHYFASLLFLRYGGID